MFFLKLHGRMAQDWFFNQEIMKMTVEPMENSGALLLVVPFCVALLSSFVIDHASGMQPACVLALFCGKRDHFNAPGATVMGRPKPYHDLCRPWSSHRSLKSVIAGAAIELGLPYHFSAEVDALYRPLRTEFVNTLNGQRGDPFTGSVATWEFPVLAKYRFGSRLPAVRRSRAVVSISALSNYGASAGVGVEAHLRALKMAPTVRYTHWAAESLQSAVLQNQAELLVGLSFQVQLRGALAGGTTPHIAWENWRLPASVRHSGSNNSMLLPSGDESLSLSIGHFHGYWLARCQPEAQENS
jgi:hypothetical protein